MHVIDHIKSALLLIILCSSCLLARGQERCDSLLIKGIYQMQHEKYRESIELLLQAKKLAEKHNSYRQQFLANNNLGANYFTMLDYGEALKYYLEGYRIATAHLDTSFRMTALNNIAILYSKEGKYSKALEYFSMAYNYALSQKEVERTGLYSMNIGILAYEMGDYPKARHYIAFAKDKVKKKGEQLLVCLTSARIEQRQGHSTQARYSAKQALEQFKGSGFTDLLLNLKIVIAESYIDEASYTQADSIIRQSLSLVVNPETKRELFRLLSGAYEKEGDYKSALIYRDSVYATEVKISKAKNEHAFAYNKLRFEIEDYKNREQQGIRDNEMQRKTYMITIALLVITVAAAGVYLRGIFQKKKMLAEKIQQQVLLELEREKNEKLLMEKDMKEKQAVTAREKEELNASVREKNKELSIKAFSLSKRNELIEEIIGTFSKIPEISENHLFISYLKRLKKEVNPSGEWDDFTRHFNELNYEFIKKLKERHPSLLKNDVRFIIYIYMNLSTKEIASLIGITTESTRKRKERIAIKMGLQSSRLMYDYIIAL